jgi:hypothetical protein
MRITAVLFAITLAASSSLAFAAGGGGSGGRRRWEFFRFFVST